MGAALVTETMEKRPEIGFTSYDRFFPNQDTMPLGGFGNLIALPLQRRAREKGASVFVDENLKPYDDQWAFLSTAPRNPAEVIFGIANEPEASGRILGVRMPVDDEFADEPWKMSPSRRTRPAQIEALSNRVNVVIADQIYVERAELPPALVSQLIRLAAFQNPEFYRAQAMRLPTSASPGSYRAPSFIPARGVAARLSRRGERTRADTWNRLSVEDRRSAVEPLFRGCIVPGRVPAVTAPRPFRTPGHDHGAAHRRDSVRQRSSPQ